MNFRELFQQRNWPAIFGYFLFIGMMAAGYYYNLTFVQLGLEDFTSRQLGLHAADTAQNMALLAICTCLIALASGWWMAKNDLHRKFQYKLKISFGVILTQLVLTYAIPFVHSEIWFTCWLILASAALGVGVPTMFSMTADLIPVRDRGYAAALVTASSYFAAAVFSKEWTVEFFRQQFLWILLAGAIGVGTLAFIKHPWIEALASQHLDPAFGIGRFVRTRSGQVIRPSRRVRALVLAMFLIYFVDSLGFLRMLKVPGLMDSSWQSPLVADRLFIAVVHVVGALIGGVLYSTLNERHLFYWIFGLFALTHLQYSLHIRTMGEGEITLALPMLYALAVSLYTVVNFAIWADLSTPETISINAALGVALSAWTATFLSTGLAICWQEQGMPLERHIQIVDAVAMIAFIGLIVMAFFRKGVKTQ